MGSFFEKIAVPKKGLRLGWIGVTALLIAVLNTGCKGGGSADSPSTGTTPATLLQETAFDADWSDTGVFSGAQTCASCHRASAAAPGVMTYDNTDISPAAGWEHGMMAQSFSDPYFQAAVIEETEVIPGMAGAIEDTCLSCHAPMGHANAHHTGQDLDAQGHYRFATALTQMHAREGISCTACHQIQDDGNLGTAASFSGHYTISSTTRLIFGPYANPVTGAMNNNTQYTPEYGNHMAASAMCATCHTLFTPTVDADTNLPTGGEFPEQTPFLEWQNSVYATGNAQEAQCQQCHMPEPEPGFSTVIATRNGQPPPRGWPERTPFHTHSMPGGNAQPSNC